MLKDANGLRALRRAIRNILDYGLDARLQKLCVALDAYRQRIITEREAVTAEKNQRDMGKTQPQPEQRRRSKRGQLLSHEQQADQGPHDQAEERVPANANKHQGDGSKEKSQAGRQSRRKQATARRQQGQNQARVPTKAVRTRRGANITGLN